MIRLNIISRIAGDKDFFSHYLETVQKYFQKITLQFLLILLVQ